jgi:type II secretory pathway pseudopilin PulG
MSRRDRGITLVEITALVTVLAIFVTILIPALLRGRRQEKIQACQSNLKALFQAQTAHAASNPKFEPGRGYWLQLTKTSPPLVTPDLLHCPLAVVPDPLGCDYFGPSSEVASRPPNDPIGCDRDTNHSDDGKQGGCILLKSGEVVVDHRGLWSGAFQIGRCKP